MPPGTQQVKYSEPLVELAHNAGFAVLLMYNLWTISKDSSGVTA